MRLSIAEFTNHKDAVAALREIFILSAFQPFASDLEAEAAFVRWTGYYLAGDPRFVHLWLENGQVVAYLMGCPDSAAASAQLAQAQPTYRLFEHHFAAFPAHLHINCHPLARNRGIGKALVESFVREVGRGVHVVTAQGARNVDFYKGCGFVEIETHQFAGKTLLLLGNS